MNWTLAQAKNQLSELVRRTKSDGPQTISVRGRDEVVVITVAEHAELQSQEKPTSFKAWLKTLDLEGVDLTRDPTPARDIDL